MPKHRLREQSLAKRQALPPVERVAAESAIQSSFIALQSYRDAGSVALYVPVRGEVATDLVIADAHSAGKRVYLPAVTAEGMVFRRFESGGSLSKGAFGISEPTADAEAVLPSMIDLIVVPGVAFTLDGHRIGYGKGFYDRALHSLEMKGRLVAFSFECQLVETAVNEPHDVLMDAIITERRIIFPALMK